MRVVGLGAFLIGLGVALFAVLPAAAQPVGVQKAGACAYLSTDVRYGNGVIARFMTPAQRDRVTADVLRTTGRTIDPRYASNVNVAVRIEGRRQLLRVVVPQGLEAMVGEHVKFTRPHTVKGHPCDQIPNLLIPPAVS